MKNGLGLRENMERGRLQRWDNPSPSAYGTREHTLLKGSEGFKRVQKGPIREFVVHLKLLT